MEWNSSFAHSLSARRWWRWILVGWSALILLQITQNYAFCMAVGMPWSWKFSIQYAAIEFSFWAVMIGIIAHWTQTYPLEDASRGKNLTILLSLTAVTLLIHAVYRVPLHYVMYNDPEPRPLVHLFTFQLIDNSLTDSAVFWAIVGICQAILSVGRAQQREHELTKAQLEMLKGQLQPHFLFNTLNSISWLMRKDVEAADNVISALSTFLRTTLTVPGSEEVALREELKVLRLYLEIEEARFQNRLKVSINVEPEALDCRVPGLLLQPMVENAVRHGIARIESSGIVEIGARRDGADLRLWVLDNGPGLTTATRQGEGIGMANTRTRLEKYYGSQQSLRISNRDDGGVRVEIRLPFEISKYLGNRDELHEIANTRC
jgi:signal transduction histidine kinase